MLHLNRHKFPAAAICVTALAAPASGADMAPFITFTGRLGSPTFKLEQSTGGELVAGKTLPAVAGRPAVTTPSYTTPLVVTGAWDPVGVLETLLPLFSNASASPLDAVVIWYEHARAKQGVGYRLSAVTRFDVPGTYEWADRGAFAVTATVTRSGSFTPPSGQQELSAPFDYEPFSITQEVPSNGLGLVVHGVVRASDVAAWSQRNPGGGKAWLDWVHEQGSHGLHLSFTGVTIAGSSDDPHPAPSGARTMRLVVKTSQVAVSWD
jgi:hypothetical protein